MGEQTMQLLALLELASAFVANKTDHRHYLHDVFVDKLQDSINLVASDGHKLIKINIKPFHFINGIDLPERINAQSIKDAIKCKRLDIVQASAINTAIKYPDYNRLIPSIIGYESSPRINAVYLAQAFTALGKCFKKFDHKYYGVDFINLSDNNGNVFQAEINENISITFVVMPMRK